MLIRSGAALSMDASAPVTVRAGNSTRGSYALGLVTATPGEYALCWASTGSTVAELTTSIGTLSLAGPAAMTAVCTLGHPCRAFLQGHRLEAANRIRIVAYAEACGGLTPSVNWTGLGASPFQSADGTNYSLGTPVTGTAGLYTVCWGADASYMNVTVPANLTLVGPHIATHQCTLGLQCNITLAGHRLGPGVASQVWVTTNATFCASGVNRLANFTGWASFPVTEHAVEARENATDLYVIGLATAGVPGAYQLCWRAGNGTGISAGTLNVRGTAVLPERIVCTLGVPCNVDLQGVSLSALDHVVVVNGTCGSGTNATVPSLVSTIDPGSWAQSPRAELGTAYAGAPDTDYRLCYSPGE